MGFLERLKDGLSKTRRNFTDRIEELVGTAGLLCTGGRIGAVSGVEGYKTQDRKSSRNRCAGLGGAGSPVLSVYHPIRSHLWGVLLKNDEMAIPVAAHHLWLSLPQRPLVLFSRQTVSSVCPLHRRIDRNSSGSGGVLDVRSAGW